MKGKKKEKWERCERGRGKNRRMAERRHGRCDEGETEGLGRKQGEIMIGLGKMKEGKII